MQQKISGIYAIIDTGVAYKVHFEAHCGCHPEAGAEGSPDRTRGILRFAQNDSQDFSACSNITPPELARQYLEGGAQLIQLRQKEADQESKKRWAKEIVGLKKSYDFTFIINDDPKLVLEVGADGVHLGQGDMKVSDARQLLGHEKIIGKSTHSLDEAIKAEREMCRDRTMSCPYYIAFGAIFPTTSKPKGHPVVGLNGLKEVLQKIRIPVVAIGGINRSNVEDVIKTGVSSVAMISALSGTENVVKETRWFAEVVNRM